MSERCALVYTDGACSGNPGPGGWAAIVATPEGRVREIGGAQARTTNNRVELIAVIAALRALPPESAYAVRIHTDSSYVVDGITKWLRSWARRGWTTAAGAPVKNRDLWETLDALVRARPPAGPLEWVRVPGHAGIPANERCDRMAVLYSNGGAPKLYDGPASGYTVTLSAPRTLLPR